MRWRVESHRNYHLAFTVLHWVGIVLISAFLIDHFELFGLKRVWCCLSVPFRNGHAAESFAAAGCDLRPKRHRFH